MMVFFFHFSGKLLKYIYKYNKKANIELISCLILFNATKIHHKKVIKVGGNQLPLKSHCNYYVHHNLLKAASRHSKLNLQTFTDSNNN